MKIHVINTHHENNDVVVTFKYWDEKECACLAVKVKRTFDHIPTEIELLNSI